MLRVLNKQKNIKIKKKVEIKKKETIIQNADRKNNLILIENLL